MSIQRSLPLPPVTEQELHDKAALNLDRLRAAEAARALRAWLADPSAGGTVSTLHLNLAQPRRGLWCDTWSRLPGLMRDRATGAFTHTLLPKWQYTEAEMRNEMIEDLEAFAETGEQPKEITRVKP